MRFAILATLLALGLGTAAQAFPNNCHLCGCCHPPLTVAQLRAAG